MALRIGGPAAPMEEELPIEEELPVEEMPTEEPMMDEEPVMEEPAGTVDPMIAGYRTPDMGPFQCSNCIHYRGGACDIVAGPVEDEGLCNLFTGPGATEEEPMPEEMPMEEEAPLEEPLPEEEV